MTHSLSFKPLAGRIAHTLILGTMPGQESLRTTRYYAHPRNAFWPIMLAIILGEQPAYESRQAMDYRTRCTLLTEHGYAVWDVLASCERPGSLDSKIVRSSEQANDIAGLARRHPELRRIAFNGKTAESLFRRHINLSALPQHAALKLVSLPSSSPAMASLDLPRKHQRWADGLLG